MKTTEHIEYLLRQGRKPTELVELGFPKRVVTKVHRQLKKEKSAERAVSFDDAKPDSPSSSGSVSATERPSATASLQPLSAQTAEKWGSLLPIVADLIAAAEARGAEQQEACPYLEDDVCTRLLWDYQGEVPEGIGQPVPADLREGGWYVKPSSIYCAFCFLALKDHVDECEETLKADPLAGAKDQFTCLGCGSKGWVAAAIKCTKCGHDSYFGWHPKR